MSFLQPTFLVAMLPLIALPVVIHLINQRRYQTVPWGAMMFLLTANRMSRGYARIRQWLILSARMLAIAALVLVIGRPLTGGWLGLTAGSRADLTVLILDRSPSMQQQAGGSGASKLEAGRRQLVQTLKLLGKSRWVLIDAISSQPRELESVDALLTSPDTGPTGASADLPTMLRAARDAIEANQAGQTDVWICSDLRENDWDPDGGQWQTVRDAFLEYGRRVRFHLLAYAQNSRANLSIRVTRVKRQESSEGVELLVSLRLAREGTSDNAQTTVPVQFEIEGARSEVAVELSGREAELKDYRVVLEKGRGRGWGKVSIPLDSNPSDNAYWFAFDQPKPRRAVVVAEDPEVARPLQLAASIAPDPTIQCISEVVGFEGVTGVEWEQVSLLLWQAAIPQGEPAKLIQAFVDRGGRVIFFPPKVPTEAAFLGVRWKNWSDGAQPAPIDGWRGDADLLAQTVSGSSLPVGQLEVRKYCRLEGETTTLATLKGSAPLLSRVATNQGGVYFCSTSATEENSSLASGGVVFYILVQRALADGAVALENVRQLAAGEYQEDDLKGWKPMAGPEGVLSTDYAIQPGIYEGGDRLFAVNRRATEDLAPVLAPPRVAALFQGLDFSQVDDSSDADASLIQEIWRLFLVAMLVALVLEAVLCLPKTARPVGVGS